jgi:NAD(P)-dependent dehydrogenase (short-subunit alcohol dehydrogenase family)
MKRNKWTLENIPDSKETAIITGANSGLGFELACQLAAKGFHVIMACRNVSNGKQAQSQILKTHSDAQVSVEALDLSDFSSIRNFAKRILAQNKALSLLVNNAGIFDVPYSKTKDGNEIVFQTNYLGPFLLTALLFPLLEAANSSRVVAVSSFLASKAKLNLDQLQLDAQSYNKDIVYAHSKLADLLFAVELHRRLQRTGSHVASVAAHPGYASTNIFSHSPSWLRTVMYAIGKAVLAQDASKGIIPIAYACVGADVQSGDYFGPNGILLGLRGDHPKLVTKNKQAKDEKLCAELWSASEKLVDTTFVINGTERFASTDSIEKIERPAMSLKLDAVT